MTRERRLCERRCAACGHHHAHHVEDGACFSGDRGPSEVGFNRCPCPHKHGIDHIRTIVGERTRELMQETVTPSDDLIAHGAHGVVNPFEPLPAELSRLHENLGAALAVLARHKSSRWPAKAHRHLVAAQEQLALAQAALKEVTP